MNEESMKAGGSSGPDLHGGRELSHSELGPLQRSQEEGGPLTSRWRLREPWIGCRQNLHIFSAHLHSSVD